MPHEIIDQLLTVQENFGERINNIGTPPGSPNSSTLPESCHSSVSLYFSDVHVKEAFSLLLGIMALRCNYRTSKPDNIESSEKLERGVQSVRNTFKVL